MKEKKNAPWYKQLWSRFSLGAGTADESIALTNYFDTLYTGSIFVDGTDFEEVEVVFDTGSNWSILFDQEDCTTCDSNGFTKTGHGSFSNNLADTDTRAW